MERGERGKMNRSATLGCSVIGSSFVNEGRREGQVEKRVTNRRVMRSVSRSEQAVWKNNTLTTICAS